ncbi:MAG: phosphoribosyl-AMP cyclohydrolase [Saprospiraceae bacterium]|nr:phosphoribosyl-AMP cyclohydrolase [Saprospiraceae bacterium]
MDAINLDFKKGDGLIPAIIQDDRTAKVLMLGYMNVEAFEQTKSTGNVVFYSRSKERLWMKGESSGNILSVQSIQKDCDKDCLLIKVIPAGPV